MHFPCVQFQLFILHVQLPEISRLSPISRLTFVSTLLKRDWTNSALVSSFSDTLSSETLIISDTGAGVDTADFLSTGWLLAGTTSSREYFSFFWSCVNLSSIELTLPDG